MNDDIIREMTVIPTHPNLFAFHSDKEGMEQEMADEDDICYCSIYINYPDNRVYCISQGWVLRIHGRDVPGSDLEDALQFLSTKDLNDSAEICSECLYKFLLTLADTFADTMTLKEKTDEIKRYVDKFSLMIAVKHSQMDDQMERIGDEDDIDQATDHFEFLRSYLIQLMDQQNRLQALLKDLKSEGAEEWVMDLVRERERLARLEYQFYSQTLLLRVVNDFNLLLRMLSFILKTSDEILGINEKIHEEILSNRFAAKAEDDERLSSLKSYAEKSRTVEHNFGNILQILSRL
ncbi:hypothetical protein EU545_00995 [Candidatus Thorarchaeota archaeon]|nr:MAG: hypothetical protein EU545_00995 [Candidatus Thorarchaeota archaeon]